MTDRIQPFGFYSGAPSADDPLWALFRVPDERIFAHFAQASLDPATVAVDDFAIEPHRIAMQHWLDNRRGDDLPPAAAIDPTALRKALGYLLVLEPDAAFDDFRYRLYGSRIVEWYKRDMTGHWVSEFPSQPAAVFAQQYRALKVLRRPIYGEHDAPPEVSAIVRWCRLILPYADEGGAISRILVANVPQARTRMPGLIVR